MEFIVQKVGMSRTVGSPSNAVTLLKLVNSKVCSAESGVAFVAYSQGKKFNKAIEGQQKKYGLSREYNRFVNLEYDENPLDVGLLTEGSTLKVSFRTKGRGFSGVMKRWNFQGGPVAHGSRFHRRPGSIGNREWPGRVQPGKKMAGHYGDELVSVNARIASFDKESGIIVVVGSVSGHVGAYGRVKVVKRRVK